MKMKVKEPGFKYDQVMLLDDNDLDNFINKKMIEASHFAKYIFVNTSGKSAIEFLNNLNVSGGMLSQLFPRVIFIDLNMPMMDGFQFIESLKKMHSELLKNCKLVILTSSSHVEDQNKAKVIGESITYLNKPLTAAMLNSI